MAVPLQPPGISAASTEVPSVAPSMGVASTQRMAYPAMALMMPLGALQPAQPLGLNNPVEQPPPQADEVKTEKSVLPKLQMKGGDVTVHSDHKRVAFERLVIHSSAGLASSSHCSQSCTSAVDNADTCATGSDS